VFLGEIFEKFSMLQKDLSILAFAARFAEAADNREFCSSEPPVTNAVAFKNSRRLKLASRSFRFNSMHTITLLKYF